MNQSRVYKYFAFISYSSKDAAFAEKVQRFLTYFKLPNRLCKKYPEKPDNVRPIYRDKTDLVIDKLNDSLKNALEVSKYLIVICSENSANPNEDGKNWIDEEVRTFISLAPENVHRVIPILLRNDKNSEVWDCMPPAVKEFGLLAADVQVRGEQRVFSDVVAKMLDLGPDELWDWVGREMRRKKIINRIMCGLVTMLTIGGGYFAWDYFVPKVSYYADYVERYNLPVGVDPLTEDEVKTRNIVYRFTEQGYKLRRVDCCNSVGELSDNKYVWARFRPVSMTIEYRDDKEIEQGGVEKVMHYNKEGKLIRTYSYDNLNTIRFEAIDNKDGSSIPTNAMKGLGMNAEWQPYIPRNVVERKDGYIQKRWYKSWNNEPCVDEYGVWGVVYEQNAKGQVVKERYVDAEGNIIRTRQGVCGENLTYSKDTGYLESVSFVDEKNRLAMNFGEMYAHAKIQWERGNVKSISVYDAAMVPCLDGKTKVHKLVFDYDHQGNNTWQSYYGVDDRWCYNVQGIASFSQAFNNKGNVVKQIGYNEKKERSAGYVGVAEIRYEEELLEKGKVIRATYYGVNGEICRRKEGFALLESYIDEKGRLVKEIVRDEKNDRCFHVNLVSESRYHYTPQGNLDEVSYFDTKGEPCVNMALGVSKIKTIYNHEGLPERRIFYGKDGMRCLNNEGVAEIRQKYNDRGLVEEIFFFDTNENPCIDTSLGYARAVYQYFSHNGFLKSVECFDLNNQRGLNKKGVSKVGYTYNVKGLVKEEISYGIDNKPCLNIDGVAMYEYVYDTQGRLKGTLGRDMKGNVVLLPLSTGGCIKNKYNDKNSLLESVCYEANGELGVNPEVGCAIVRHEYDTNNRHVKISFFNKENQPCMSSTFECAEMRFVRDEYNNVLHFSTYDEKGNCIYNSDK